MSEEIAEYEIGKRHVANIMGLDPETISQEDIDVSLSQSHSIIVVNFINSQWINKRICYVMLSLPRRFDCLFV